MRAYVSKKYGGPDVLLLQKVEKPAPKHDEILIKVEAVSINPLDWHCMRGSPYFMRFVIGLFRPKMKILGADIAGTVEAVGKNVTEYKPGDEVFGDIFKTGLGGFAEYVCTKAERIALKPANVSFIEAAGVPVAALTALHGLKHKGEIKAGQKVLINGASGGVGTFAVQLAKHFGAEVTAVCSTAKMEIAKSIGADKIIDYTKQDFIQTERNYDLMLDIVGNLSVPAIKKVLKPEGICPVIGFTSVGQLIHISRKGSWKKKNGKPTIGMLTSEATHKDIAFLGQLLEEEKIKPVIDKEYPFYDLPEAMVYQEAGHASGKVVVSIQ